MLNYYMSFHVIVMSCHVTCRVVYHVMCRVMSCHVCRVMSCNMSCRVIMSRVMSLCHVMCRVMSCHTIITCSTDRRSVMVQLHTLKQLSACESPTPALSHQYT